MQCFVVLLLSFCSFGIGFLNLVSVESFLRQSQTFCKWFKSRVGEDSNQGSSTIPDYYTSINYPTRTSLTVFGSTKVLKQRFPSSPVLHLKPTTPSTLLTPPEVSVPSIEWVNEKSAVSLLFITLIIRNNIKLATFNTFAQFSPSETRTKLFLKAFSDPLCTVKTGCNGLIKHFLHWIRFTFFIFSSSEALNPLNSRTSQIHLNAYILSGPSYA